MKLGFWEKLGIAIKSYIDALVFVFQNGLWPYFAYPIIIAILMIIGSYYLVDWMAEAFQQWISGFFAFDKDGWLGFLTGFLEFFVRIGLKIFFFFIFSTFSKYILLIVMSPIMALLSEKTDEIITGKKYPFQLDQFVRDVFRGIGIALRNMFIEFGLLFASLFVMWIPIIGWVTPLFLLIISYYFYGFSMIDYTCERRKMGIGKSTEYIRNNKGLAIGNGFIFSLIFAIPYAGGMLVSVLAPVAGTMALLEIEKKQASQN